MDTLLLLLLLSSGVHADGKNNSKDFEFSLVDGAHRCSGTLEVKLLGEWRRVNGAGWSLKTAAVVCKYMDCGSVVSVKQGLSSSERPVRWIEYSCLESGYDLRKCSTTYDSLDLLNLTCSDSVRLINGTSLCSGRLEVSSNQFNQVNQSEQRWSSVCEADFDQQDAEVVCRELGCGAPSVLRGALYGDVEALMWTKEFQCGGTESALLDCRSSGSARSSCSPGKAIGLTCSEPDEVRLVGGASRCAGTLELKHLGEWRAVIGSPWVLRTAAFACGHLNCGSVVSFEEGAGSSFRPVWWLQRDCVQSGSELRACAKSDSHSSILNLTCSDSVRLINGTSLCSGRLEVSSNQFNQLNQSEQRWSSVCEADFDQQDAEVVCRELGCGAPSVLRGALYGDVEALMWIKEFQCGGTESALLDCRSSSSARSSCSPGKAVGLTCSEPDEVRLVGGASRCAGTLELKHLGEWRAVTGSPWNLKTAAVLCEFLDCGSVVSVGDTSESSSIPLWAFDFHCVQSASNLQECATNINYFITNNLTCSDSVRLINGTSLCSGRLEVSSNQFNQLNQSEQRWSSVCEADFDQQDAEVVCRELSCGAPSVLRGALYGDVEAPMWTKEFQCGGTESALLDCRSSGSARSSCSPGKAVGLTCSEPIRLVGGASRCAGTLEVKLWGEWRAVFLFRYTLETASFICQHLDCRSAVSVEEREESSPIPGWRITSECVQSGLDLRECAEPSKELSFTNITCSDLLLQPNISLSSVDGVAKVQQQGFQVFRSSTFIISCSIQPQYPGGSFQLTFTSSNTSYSYTQPATNHSADFPFPAAEPAHHGNYSCVYHVFVYSHNFSSESHLLSLAVQDPTGGITRAALLSVTVLLLLTAVLCCCCKASRRQSAGGQEGIEQDYYNVAVASAAEGGPPEEDGAQEAESAL